ncbi:MAG: biotin/lipoyl-binding protein, partial [Pseudomonadales bacterium]|nr:biotin/lipoyl-binding protein [Pseudomonadales bacterium]
MMTRLTERFGRTLHGRPGLKRAGVATLILVGGITTAGALVATTPSTPAEEPEERAWPVSVQVAAPARRSPVLSLFGRVESAAVSELEARVAAPIAEVLVREGERVEAGQLLVRLDDAEARLALAEREADLRVVRAALERTRNAAALGARTADDQASLLAMVDEKLERFSSLFERGMVARDALDAVRREASRARIEFERHSTDLADFPHRIAEAEAQVARAEVARDRAAIELDRTRVTAPFPGPVARVAVARGDQVTVGTPLLTLVDETSVELRVPVPADEAQALRGRLTAGRSAVAEARAGDERLQLPLARLAGDQKDGSPVVDAFFRL